MPEQKTTITSGTPLAAKPAPRPFLKRFDLSPEARNLHPAVAHFGTDYDIFEDGEQGGYYILDAAGKATDFEGFYEAFAYVKNPTPAAPVVPAPAQAATPVSSVTPAAPAIPAAPAPTPAASAPVTTAPVVPTAAAPATPTVAAAALAPAPTAAKT